MNSIADEIDRLAAQHDAGRLTDAEFEAAKARLFADAAVDDGRARVSHDPAGAAPASDAWRSAAAEADDAVRNLRRSTSDRWLGGVCGGIARLLGVESWIVRLAFAATLLFAGIGLLPYALLWIFVPPDGR